MFEYHSQKIVLFFFQDFGCSFIRQCWSEQYARFKNTSEDRKTSVELTKNNTSTISTLEQGVGIERSRSRKSPTSDGTTDGTTEGTTDAASTSGVEMKEDISCAEHGREKKNLARRKWSRATSYLTVLVCSLCTGVPFVMLIFS